jgi:hypothetical protein
MLDISKAFDAVWVAGLLFKLERKGISGPLLAFFRSYLSGRAQRVVVDGERSTLLPVGAGVPQGSVFGPILFLVFIDCLWDVVENNLSVFADDSTLWAAIPKKGDRASVADSLNRDLAAIQDWANRWAVKYNHTKTELLTISNATDVQAFRRNGLDKDKHVKPSPNPNPHPILSFNGCVLPESISAKGVGITFTTNMTWTAHLNNIARSASLSLFFLKRASPYLSQSDMLTLYKSKVRSRMEYCAPLWAGAGSSALARLDSIQKQASKLFTDKGAADLSSLSHRRAVSGVCLMHRLLHSTAPAGVRDLCPSRSLRPTRSTRRSNTSKHFFTPPEVKRNTPKYWTNSFVPFFTDIWNTMSEEVQNISDLGLFKQAALDGKADFGMKVHNFKLE